MSSNDDMEARHGRMLAELAEAGMGVARRLSGALAEVEGVQELVQLGEAFHSVSRSVRQTIALEFKLRLAPREPAAPKPEPKPEPMPAASPPPERPEAPERIYWNEYERCDWDEPLEALVDAGDREAINEAVETSIARIRRGLAKADAVLTRRDSRAPAPASAAAKTVPRTRSALLGTSSPLGRALPLPRKPNDSGGSMPPRPPPWRNSG